MINEPLELIIGQVIKHNTESRKLTLAKGIYFARDFLQGMHSYLRQNLRSDILDLTKGKLPWIFEAHTRFLGQRIEDFSSSSSVMSMGYCVIEDAITSALELPANRDLMGEDLMKLMAKQYVDSAWLVLESLEDNYDVILDPMARRLAKGVLVYYPYRRLLASPPIREEMN